MKEVAGVCNSNEKEIQMLTCLLEEQSTQNLKFLGLTIHMKKRKFQLGY